MENSDKVSADPGLEASRVFTTPTELFRILKGVFRATKAHGGGISKFEDWVTSQSPAAWNPPDLAPQTDGKNGNTGTPWFLAWQDLLPSICFEDNGQLRPLVNLALVVVYLRTRRQQSSLLDARDITALWEVMHHAFTNKQSDLPLPNVFCSIHRYYVVPFCLIESGSENGLESYGVHVWLPDDKREVSNTSIQCCQGSIQGSLLVGEGQYNIFAVQTEPLVEPATHEEILYQSLSHESCCMSSSSGQVCPSFQRKRQSNQATQTQSHFQLLNMSYRIEVETWHTLEVPSDILRADLVVANFHSVVDAYGPKPEDAGVNQTDRSTESLASSIHTVRAWQILHEEGKYHARRSKMEEALRIFNTALSLCENVDGFPNSSHYANLVHAELGFVNRCLGRYKMAKYHLEEAVKEPEVNWCRLKSSGELGTVYRAMNQLHEAKAAFETQYEIAKRLNNKNTICRAVGNLGMTNYQLSQQESDPELLQLAVTQLKERVDSARQITDTLQQGNMDAKEKVARLKQTAVWTTIGLNRLSLCYTAQGKSREAVQAAKESQSITILPEDPTVIAMSHFFCGRALLHDGQREAALSHFNPPQACMPAIALCKEPSEENRQYLKELVEFGVDMSLIDEYGYTALDYTVFSQDPEMEALVIKGLRPTIKQDADRKINQLRTEASLRKRYRELFQDDMRPVLLSGGHRALQKLRLEYANALGARGQDMRTIRFDTLKYVRYQDFLHIGRLPRHSDGFTKDFQSELNAGMAAESLIFISYRWLNTINRRCLPDDKENSQYKRMVIAVKALLDLNPHLHPEKLGIWLDYACIDQDDPIPGVTALPMLLAQCDAVISLVDETYYDRAWCTIEAFLIQTLRKSYSIHDWYEHVALPGSAGSWTLRPGPLEFDITPGTKELSYEEDRSKILFLERQTKLLR